MSAPLKSLEKYRSAYYKLRSVLHDRRANLPAFPAVLDQVRSLLDQRTTIGVVHLGIEDLAALESIYGWQVHDEVLAHAAAHVRALAAVSLHPDTIVTLNRVAGEAIVLFVPATLDGRPLDGTELAALTGRLESGLRQAFTPSVLAEDGLDTLNPPVRIHSGHSFLGLNPFFRFERAIYRSIAAAAGQESERRARRERRQLGELERILEDGDLRVHFQPVLALGTGEVHGYEALTRGPRDSAVERPRELFRVSRRAGISSRVEALCRSLALEGAATLPGRGKLFLNMTADAIVEDALAGGSASVAQDRFDVVIDLSERELVGVNEAVLLEAVERMRSRGFSIALDDLGAGSSRLETLERLKPDYLKLDGSVVRSIDKHPIKQEVLRSLLEFADRTDARLIAEEVETAEEAEFLESAGAPLAQGFFWSDPLPVSALPVHR